MSAMRYSGELRIRVTYLEPWAAGTPAPAGRSTRLHGEYRCFIRGPKGTVGKTIHVSAPVVIMSAVDSAVAFDEAARAALSFAFSTGWPVDSHAANDEAGYYIGRSPARAWPADGATIPAPAPEGCEDLPPVLDPSNVQVQS